MSRFLCGSPFLYGFSFLPRAWLLLGMQISSVNLVRIADGRVLSTGETLRLVTEEEEIIPAGGLFLGMGPRVVTTCSYRYGGGFNCSDSIKSRSEKYLLWKARTSRSKCVRSFLICLFSFLTTHFKLARTVQFYDAAFDLPSSLFLFLQHVFIRNIPNLFRCRRM